MQISGPITLTHPDSDVSNGVLSLPKDKDVNEGPLIVVGKNHTGVRSLSSSGGSRRPTVATLAGGRSSSPVPVRTTTVVRGRTRSPSPLPVRTTTTIVSPRSEQTRRVRRRRSHSRRRVHSPLGSYRGYYRHGRYYGDGYDYLPSTAVVGNPYAVSAVYHDTELNNEIKKATCNVRCGKNLTGPYTSREEQRARSTCQLKCYRNNFVRVSGDEKCDLACGAKYGTTDRNDPYGKEICRRYDCAYINTDDTRPIYRL